MGSNIDNSLILNKIKSHYDFKNDAEFARFLDIKPNTLSNWHSRNTIDYTKVKIFKGSYFSFDLQNEDTFVTPNGSIFIMEKHFKTDYSAASDDYKKIFLHELGHVW